MTADTSRAGPVAVIFEAELRPGAQAEYLRLAEALRPQLAKIDGFLSIERFSSLSQPGKLMSLSFWRDEAAVAAWRALPEHRSAQAEGRGAIFAGYRLRVAAVHRDYGMAARDGAPADSRAAHDGSLADV